MAGDIIFTQFLYPMGRRREVSIERDDIICCLARAFVKRGGWFECEMLRTGHAHLTACFVVPGEGADDIEREVVPNGPAVEDAVDRLVIRGLARVESRTLRG